MTPDGGFDGAADLSTANRPSASPFSSRCLVGGSRSRFRSVFSVSRNLKLAALVGGIAALANQAQAHMFAGDHMFISTLIVDNPMPLDAASLPNFSYLPQPSNGGPAPGLYNLQGTFDKRITENLGFYIEESYNWLTQPGAKTATGWSNLTVALQYRAYVSAEHEFVTSVGVEREFARTGATGTNGALLGNDDSSFTTPTIYFGKGFGDLPIGWLRPLALTGELGYTIADTKLKVDPAGLPVNNGRDNAWTGGLTLQYSMRYLSSPMNYNLPTFVNRLTPVAELSWSSPASRPNDGDSTKYLFAVGLNYTERNYSFAVEALIPGNKETGSHLGVIAQFYLFFDDLLPHSLGKPIAEWF
jgi:hypothetical protein